MDSSSSNVSHLATLHDMTQFIESNDTCIILFHGEKCKPCQRLKPHLIEKCDTHNIPLAMITWKADKEANVYVDLKKVPYVVLAQQHSIKAKIQNSNIEVTWPFIESNMTPQTPQTPKPRKPCKLVFDGDF